jgi:hypothetical protein
VRLAALVLGLALVFVAAASGSFVNGPGSPVAVGSQPVQIQLSDLNGDGRQDIVVANGDASLWSFLGNGSGGFAKVPGTPPTEANLGSFGLADLNGDHKPDMVAINYSGLAYSIFLNNGKGAFTVHGSPIAFQAGSQPGYPAFGDFNGDGKMDMVLPSSFIAGLDIVLGDGSGSFVEAPSSPLIYGNAYGGGHFADGPLQALVGFFDNDDIPDLAVLNEIGTVNILIGNGDGTFALPSPILTTGAGPSWMAAGDFNGDGHADLAVANVTDNNITTYLGDGNGGFADGNSIGTNSPSQVVAGDFNGDHRLDLATFDGSGNDDHVDVLLGDAEDDFAEEPGAPFTVAGSPGIYWMDGANLNSDKKTDLVFADDATNKVSVLLHAAGALPAAASITPVAQLPAQPIVVKGTNLQTVAMVLFGGGVPGTITAQSATQLTVTVPGSATQGKLTLIGANGSPTTSKVFTPIKDPSISSLSPPGGTKPGATLTVNGLHLTATTSVTINGENVVSFKVVSDTKITAVVPLDVASGTHNLVVTNPANTATTQFTRIVAPLNVAFTPSSGPANSSATTPVAITGSGFTGVTSVKFNGKPATTFTVDDDNDISASTPVGATTGKISVTNVSGSSTSSSVFTVLVPPSVTSFTPAKGVEGAPVTILGKNLADATKVFFGGVEQDTLTASAGEIDTTVPTGAIIGKIVVESPEGHGTSAATFTPIEAPAIDSILPAVGTKVGGAFTITGHHFSGTTSVTVGGINATFSVASDTKITATVPVGATTGSLVVTNPANNDSIPFAVIVPPVLAATGSFSPTAGGYNQTVVITGTHLTGATGVTFNGKAAKSFTVDNDGQITAHVDAGSAKGFIAVKNIAGASTTTDKFTLITITSFLPTSATSGTVVTVHGSGFLAVTGVNFAGEGTSDPANLTDTSLQFTATACGATGPITLYSGSVQIHSSTNLTYTGGLGACTKHPPHKLRR